MIVIAALSLANAAYSTWKDGNRSDTKALSDRIDALSASVAANGARIGAIEVIMPVRREMRETQIREIDSRLDRLEGRR